MRQNELSVDKEQLQVELLIFSAVSLATLEFIRNAFPATDALLVTRTTLIYMIVLVPVLPALALLAADRLIVARYGDGRRLRVFRSVLFAVALLLILRQLQLYWDPATDFADSVRSRSLVLLVFVDLLFVAAVVGFAIWAFRGLLLFFYYMSPVAIAMTVIIPFQATTMWSTPDGWDQEVVTATQSESQPAVFVIVFDEMGYDVLLNEDGELDAESFPNIAGLAQEGVWFTNATSNYYWTKESVPSIFNPVKPLGEDLNVTLSSQYLHAEVTYIKDCGKTITCRGISYLTSHDQLRLATNLALRAFYQATPKLVESALSRPMGWFLDQMGWDYPSVDGSGGLTVSKRLFDVFLDDVDAETSPGRIQALHNFLPHRPFVFDREGNAIDNPSPEWGQDTFWERYREQVMFADRLVGDLVSKLKSEGIYDQSVIVITSDHGERPFVPSPERPPDEFTPHVPLVIRAPGLNGDVSDVDYQHIDFAATLADILGLPPLNDTEGVSAFSEERPQRDKVFSVDDWAFVYSPEDATWSIQAQALSEP